MKIAVVLAHNWANTGMYSVDLSAFRLFESWGVTVDYFVASGGRTNSLFKSGQVPIYRISDAGPLIRYDRVVYWGDFTTSPYYALDDFESQLNSHDGPLSKNEVFRTWLDIFLMRGRNISETRMFSFAQNFQTLGAVSDRLNLASLGSLYERFTSIMPRDSVSTRELRTYFPSLPADIVTQGCDAAFLLPDQFTGPSERKPKQIGLFLGRTKIENRQDMIAELVRRGYNPVLLSQWLALPRNRFHENFLNLCTRIRDSVCVLTDTYHLAVNAIRIGTTPVVIGADEDAQISTVSDYKKRVMLRDLDSEDLYMALPGKFLSPELITQIADRVDAVVGAENPHPVHERSRQAAEAARSTFKAALLA